MISSNHHSSTARKSPPTGSMIMSPSVVSSSSHIQDNQVSTTDSEPVKSEDKASTPTDNPMLKEKTPMCLVNELARFNKVEHQYRLTSEEGPPHKKCFTVTLRLGTEEYTAEGPSIKKAQHSAASKAIANTSYNHPPAKTHRTNKPLKGNTTPTVELNALAMKRGENTEYTIIEVPILNHYYYHRHHHQLYSDHYEFPYAVKSWSKSNSRPVYNFSNFVQRRYQGGGGGMPPGPVGKQFKVKLIVGKREFFGVGTTTQAARHDAAAKALLTLLQLPIENNQSNCDNVVESSDPTSEIKSPISLVHEIAFKRNMSVSFELESEKGPPHMRNFITRCQVGDSFKTTGEGNGKKVSKRRAAEKMLEQLKSLPPLTVSSSCNLNKVKRRMSQTKKKPRNLIKDVSSNTLQDKYETETTEEINPISRLMQIQQSKREKEPVYCLKEERGVQRKREFLMEVSVGDLSFVGLGASKKLAKRKAADGLLQLMGYSTGPGGGSREAAAVNVTGSSATPTCHGTSKDAGAAVGGVSGRQLVPGLLLMNNDNSNNNSNQNKSGVSMKAMAAVAKEYLNSQTTTNSTTEPLGEETLRPTEQLHYLSQILHFKVQYSDFPKGKHSAFLSLVTLSTDPIRVYHGAGPTTDISQDQAALNALKALAESGLDLVTSSSPPDTTPTSVPTSAPQPQTNSPTPQVYIGINNSLSKKDNYVNGK